MARCSRLHWPCWRNWLPVARRHEPPLPTACKTALALVQEGDPRATYDGGFDIDGEVADLCLARLWPEYAELEAQAGFATWPSACTARC
jgi:hypothetical protein